MLECKQLFQTNPGTKCYRKVPSFSSCNLLVPILVNKTQPEMIVSQKLNFQVCPLKDVVEK